MILPAALRYQSQVAEAVANLKATGAVVPKAQVALLERAGRGHRRPPGGDRPADAR